MDLDFELNICHHCAIPDTFASFFQLMRNFEDDYRARWRLDIASRVVMIMHRIPKLWVDGHGAKDEMEARIMYGPELILDWPWVCENEDKSPQSTLNKFKVETNFSRGCFNFTWTALECLVFFNSHLGRGSSERHLSDPHASNPVTSIHSD